MVTAKPWQKSQWK